MMESMESPNTALQDMYDGYRGDFNGMESRFRELTGIEGMLRLKLENSGYYGVSEEEWYNESDQESDTSTQHLSESDDPDSYDEDDDYFADNTDYRWNEETAHWEMIDRDEPVWTRPVLTQELHDRIDYAMERRQQDVLIQLIRDEGNRVLYADRQRISGAPYFSWFVMKGFEEVVPFAISQLDSAADMANDDKLTGSASRWNPYHYAATSVRFDRMLSRDALLNDNVSMVWSYAARTVTSQGDTPLTLLLQRIIDEFELAQQEDTDDEALQTLSDALDTYRKIKRWMQGEGERFVFYSTMNVTQEIGNRFGSIINGLRDLEEVAEMEGDKISDMITYTVQRRVVRNLANEFNQVATIPATLGEFYTLDQFRRMAFPVEASRLTFTVPGKDLDCDVGQYETTKYMPVKLDVERTTAARSGEWIARHNWDVDGEGKLYLFCAEELKQYLTTRQGTYGLSVDNADTFFENSLPNRNPFNRKNPRNSISYTRRD